MSVSRLFYSVSLFIYTWAKIPHCLRDCSFKTGILYGTVILPALFFEIGLPILGPFCFYMYFRLSLLINFLQKNPHWDFYLDYIESINQYEENSNPVN